MWLFTKRGFLSAVQADFDPSVILVRARAERDLQAINNWMARKGKSEGQIEETPEADYQWRMLVDRRAWTSYVAAQAAGIDYTNYKNAAMQEDPSAARAEYLHNVWVAGMDFQTSQNRQASKPRSRAQSAKFEVTP